MAELEPDVDLDTHGPYNEGYDSLAHQGCYIFQPSHHDEAELNSRPKKKRKVSRSDDGAHCGTLPRLLGGKEQEQGPKLRLDTFSRLWKRQKVKIESIISQVDESAVESIARFVQDTVPLGDAKIPTGLVLASSDKTTLCGMLPRWTESPGTTGPVQIVELVSSQAPNLQTALKNIIRAAIIQSYDSAWYQDFLLAKKRLIPLNYDLDLLRIFIQNHNVQKVVLSIPDVETLDVGVLSELVLTMSSWCDQIPFVLLLGLATTVELFEAGLPRSIVRFLSATVFDLSTNRDLYHEMFRAVQADPESKVVLGDAVSNILVEMTTDQATTPAMFGKAIQYALMSHFFANALSVLLIDTPMPGTSADICEAIRNTGSFQRHTEKSLQGRKRKGLLQDDGHLLHTAKDAVMEGQQKFVRTFEAVDAFKELPKLLRLAPPANASAFDIDVEALSGREFTSSDPYTSVMSMLEKLRSDQLLSILHSCSLAKTSDSGHEPPLAKILTRLHAFQSLHNNTSIRSAYDPSHPTTATTVSKSNTISLTQPSIKLTEPEKAYTEIMDDLLATLERYFDDHITKPHYKHLFMHEAFVHDLKVPLTTAFAPKPRHAIERALDKPGDYLGCECCTGLFQDGLEHTSRDRMPPTSILWRLWCEAGAVVNVRDLWEAFKGVIVGSDGDPDKEPAEDDGEATRENGNTPERTALALFYRSLAELRMLGYVKTTKKRPAPGVDCIAKVGWRGL